MILSAALPNRWTVKAGLVVGTRLTSVLPAAHSLLAIVASAVSPQCLCAAARDCILGKCEVFGILIEGLSGEIDG